MDAPERYIGRQNTQIQGDNRQRSQVQHRVKAPSHSNEKWLERALGRQERVTGPRQTERLQWQSRPIGHIVHDTSVLRAQPALQTSVARALSGTDGT